MRGVGIAAAGPGGNPTWPQGGRFWLPCATKRPLKCGKGMNERVKQLLVLGREHYGKREFEKAEQMLRMVLEEEDRYADVHDMLGVIAHSRGNFLVAERHFERALEINPSYTEAALNLAVTYNDRGKYEKAREVYGRIKVGPTGTANGLDPFARGKIANMHADIAQAYHDAGLLR